MTTDSSQFPRLSDQQLVETVKRLAGEERHATAALIRSLMELDARRLYLGEGFPSLFVYCTQVLRLSEHAAYNRIEVARACRRHPRLLDALEDGAITLTAGRLLGAHLTEQNCKAVLAAARHKNKRPTTSPSAGTQSAVPLDVGLRAPAHRSTLQPAVMPLAPERYRIQFTATRTTHDKLRRAQDLLRHVVPNGDPAEIFDRALTLLITELERTRLATVAHPRPGRQTAGGSRHIPADVRRAVWRRDEGRCAFVGSRGRCLETGFLEWHHVQPFAMGGGATVKNIELRCAHNLYEAALLFGEKSSDVVTEGGPTSG